MGLIIVPVTIKGKQYQFLFDTGAITVFSKELYAEAGLKKITNGNVRDSGSERKKLIFTQVDELVIAGIAFQKIASSRDIIE